MLVEPAGPLNVGSVARLCANFGVDELRLVNPRCDPKDPEARRMAVHGQNVLQNARLFPSLIDALADCHRVVASCGRLDHGEIPLQAPEQAMPWVHQARDQRPRCLGVRPRRPWTQQRRAAAESARGATALGRCLSVPEFVPRGGCASARAGTHPQATRSGPRAAQAEAALPPQLDACLSDAEDLLLEAGFLLEHTAKARMAKVRALLQRALARPEEVALLRGMVRQLRWAIRSNRP